MIKSLVVFALCLLPFIAEANVLLERWAACCRVANPGDQSAETACLGADNCSASFSTAIENITIECSLNSDIRSCRRSMSAEAIWQGTRVFLGNRELRGNDLREFCTIRNNHFVWVNIIRVGQVTREQACTGNRSEEFKQRVRACQTVGVVIKNGGATCDDGRHSNDPAPQTAAATRAAQEVTNNQQGRIRGDQQEVCRNSGGLSLQRAGVGLVCICNPPKTFNSGTAACAG